MHIATSSFELDMLAREPPAANVCNQVIDVIMTDAFDTNTNPVKVCSGGPARLSEAGRAQVGDAAAPWSAAGNAIRPFSVGHHKSATRLSCLHLIVHLFLEDEVDMSAARPSSTIPSAILRLSSSSSRRSATN